MADNQVKIHSTAIVEEGAELGPGVEIGPYSIIGPKVRIGAGTKVHSHCVVVGRTTIGQDNEFFPFSTTGVTPQDLKYHGEDAELLIGDRNTFREYANVAIGTEGGGMITKVGNDNLFMIHTHVAHDCIVGNSGIFANGVSLAGHVEVFDGAVVGGHAAIHQFCKIGEMAMVGGGSMVVQDVVPYGLVQGDRAEMRGLNLTGLRRAKLTNADITSIKAMHKIVFNRDLTVEQAIETITKEVPESSQREIFIRFLKVSNRGLCR